MRSCGHKRPFASVRPPDHQERSRVRICLMIEGQEGVEWADWVALASACERLGFDALFRSDHYLSVGGGAPRGGGRARGAGRGGAAGPTQPPPPAPLSPPAVP